MRPWLLTAALLLLLTACNGASEETAAEHSSTGVTTAEFRRSVRVTQAQEGVLSTRRQATVTVEAAQESLVAAGTNGRVAQVIAVAGTQVQAGDAVVQLDDEQLRFQVDGARVALESARVNLAMAEAAAGEGTSQAQDALQTARLNLELQQRLYQQAQQLFEAGGISRAELDGAATQLSQAEAAVGQAQDAAARAGRAGGENLELLRLQVQGAETQLAQAESQLAEASVRAPFDGTVVTVLVSAGEFVGAGQPVFQLSSSGSQLARFSVPTEDAALLAANPDITISYAGRDYPARLRPSGGVPAQARQVSMTAELLEAETPIPNGAVARFGYDVELARGDLLPSGAIRAGGSVLVAEDGFAYQHEVTVVAEAGGQSVVLGLPEDARVIYPLPADLTAGTAIEVID